MSLPLSALLPDASRRLCPPSHWLSIVWTARFRIKLGLRNANQLLRSGLNARVQFQEFVAVSARLGSKWRKSEQMRSSTSLSDAESP
jgi:hypothetical protein